MQFKCLDALVGLATSLAILLALLPVEWQYPLVYQRDNFHWYQLLTANLIHENTRHLLLNLLGLVLIGFLARRCMSGPQFAVILVFGFVGAVLAEHALGQPPYMSITVAETRGLSGALHGLLRVRAFTQDDAHIFCTEEQITEECLSVTNLILEIYKDLGFENVILKYSDRPDLRVGDDNVWDKSEKALLEAIKASKLEYSINKGEGAFYGPKIEFVLRDAIGRDWQCGTLQVDLNLPGRLGATFVDKDGTKKIPVMLHRALFGSLERFIGILIENYAGKLPFWISPLQTVVIPVSSDFDSYAKQVSREIKKNGISSIVDLKNHNLNYKIREHSLSKIPILLICGKKEVDSNTVTIRRLDSNKQENMDLNLFLKKYSALNKANAK